MPGSVDRKQIHSPSNFIAGRPKTALLFWFFSDFGCGMPLFIVILVIYKYKNRLVWLVVLGLTAF